MQASNRTAARDFHGGNWVFVAVNAKQFIRRPIVLGRKMGSEYFDVLEGLKVGDKVITSSYEQFVDKQSVTYEELEKI